MGYSDLILKKPGEITILKYFNVILIIFVAII